MGERNAPCWCGSGKKWKKCHFPRRDSRTECEQHRLQFGVHCKTEEQIQGVRHACRITSKILNDVCRQAQPGVATSFLDSYAVQRMEEEGVASACLGYGSPPFPKSICTSINEEICHGIPSQRILKEGDIVNIDIACISGGYYGDCSQMVIVGGHSSPERENVVAVSKQALLASIQVLKPQVPLKIIGETIASVVKENGKFSIVEMFVGHGVGLKFHEAPQVHHFPNRSLIPLIPGMIFTIEPMINVGTKECVIDPSNQWTALTADSKPSAQWEHTILITEDGHEILTSWDEPL